MQEMDLERFDHIPERLSGLVDLSYNLWWSWHPAAKMLFKQLNRQAWKESIHNPVKMLQHIPPEFLEAACEDTGYLHRYDITLDRFRRYMNSSVSWYGEEIHAERSSSIAYFSAEYGLQHSLPFFAGGLGFLAGDHLKECSDLGVPILGVGFMYAQGYLDQDISTDGWQGSIEEMLDRDAAPITRVLGGDGGQLVVQVPLIEPPMYVAVWKVQVGRVPLYLLDTDIDRNLPEYRTISHRLYIGDREQRLRQEIVLGIGGWRVLRSLGLSVSAVHLNEGHPAFALLELIREEREAGKGVEEAMEAVRNRTVFTTHSSLPATIDVFPADLITPYFSSYLHAMGLENDDFLALGERPGHRDEGFNMTAFALRVTGYHNAVSKKHGSVARRLWRELWPDIPDEFMPIDSITNGVHLPTWLNPRMAGLYSRYIGGTCPYWKQDHDNTAIWELVDEIPDKELWEQHNWLKNKLFNRIKERKRRKWAEGLDDPLNLVAEGLMLDPSTLTIGFARRFSAYKRATLIFEDRERLKRILNNPFRPVQIIFGGKAHPDDDEGKRILQCIYRCAQDPGFGGRIAFLEDYGEQSAQYMVHGVDVWLNNPLPPWEACGTSGMKAGLNGVLNLSILDGWWIEGYNGKNGWAFGDQSPPADRDAADAAAIYDLLEREIVPLYYRRSLDGIPHGWVAMMKESIKSIAPAFCTRRMVKEYVHRYYRTVLGGKSGSS
jgi:starch phosphorylase